ncbi:MAG: lysozyme [Desulfobulbaceae bacterium]|jgi:lysozyme|nr:lysozyme [Desulfobulbaceae bacterium]
MRIPARLVELCKTFEGFHKEVRIAGLPMAAPYVCPAGYWTIGYGHLCGKNQTPITKAEAETLLMIDLQTAVAATLRYCPALGDEPEHRLAAIADFTFNLGAGRLQASTLRCRVNDRDWTGAGDQLLRWVYGGGRILPGLVLRRKAERELLLGERQ